MPTDNPFKFLDVHTNKGAAHSVAGMAVGQGSPDQQSFVTTGAFVDRETVTIGDVAAGEADVYELVDISTDSTVDVLTFWNNTDSVIIQLAIDPADYTFVTGQYVAVGTEIALVGSIAVNSATDWDVSFIRGVAGTTIQAEGTGTTAIDVQGVAALTAGAITVPAIGVTAAIGLAALASIIGNDAGRGPIGNGAHGVPTSVLPNQKQGNWSFINLDDVVGLLVSTIGGLRAQDVATDVGNAAWDETATAGGLHAGANVNMVKVITPTAADVTAGVLYIPCNFTPESASVDVYTVSTDAIVVFDGVANIDRTTNVVTVDNAGLTDWSVSTNVVVSIRGFELVEDAAVIG